LLGRPIKKTAAQADFIRCHPWRSPFGPAEAVQIFSRKICGKGVLNLKPALTTRRDDAAVLSCMAYVDLNPIRAKMAKNPETSQHTSIQKRTEAIQQNKRQPHKLLPLVGNPRQDMPQGIAFSLQDYCELVDTTGRIIRASKSRCYQLSTKPHSEPIRFIRRAMDNLDNRIRTTLLLCSGRRADDASIQNPYPQKTDRWDEAGQTTAIEGVPNKHLPCFVFFKLQRSKYA
jgi:hypothetical protein